MKCLTQCSRLMFKLMTWCGPRMTSYISNGPGQRGSPPLAWSPVSGPPLRWRLPGRGDDDFLLSAAPSATDGRGHLGDSWRPFSVAALVESVLGPRNCGEILCETQNKKHFCEDDL